MRREPLFIRFANNQVTEEQLIDTVIDHTSHEPSQKIARKRLKDLPDLSDFRKDFKNLLKDIIESGITREMINYVNSYMKPSLEEVDADVQGGRSGEHREAVLKAEDAPWPEAIICYNLCLYIKAYGIREIKECPICLKFFSNKGKYAKYCSEACKAQKAK